MGVAAAEGQQAHKVELEEDSRVSRGKESRHAGFSGRRTARGSGDLDAPRPPGDLPIRGDQTPLSSPHTHTPPALPRQDKEARERILEGEGELTPDETAVIRRKLAALDV